jgi:diguanylate cyclase (GGDEF)-like protein
VLLATQYELWRGRAENYTARWGLVALIALHMLILLGGLYDALHPHASITDGPQLNSWFGLINFEGLIFAVGAPILMVTLCRERVTQDYERASQIDSLTGVANRRGLFDGAERLLERGRADTSPVSVIAFDLDRFKTINDTHGHAVGDSVLRTFVAATRSVLRPNDFFGRHGGEEFAVVLPGATAAAAWAVAERARLAFAEAARGVDGRDVRATVSAGVAELKAGESFSDVLDAADRALYRAKSRGRNRVERAAGRTEDETALRVA